MRKEDIFILQCMRRFFNKNREIPLMEDDFNIKYILDTIKRHKVISLIQFINELNNNNCLGSYSTTTRMTSLRHKIRMDACSPLLNILNAEGIPYAVLKGYYMIEKAYGSHKYRESSDIDILVSKENAQRIKKVCYSLGFIQGDWDRVEKKIKPYTREQILFYLTKTHQLPPMVLSTGYAQMPATTVDINFSATWGEYGDDTSIGSDMLSRRELININGYNYYVLTNEVAFIQLCLHHYKECNSLFLLHQNRGLLLSIFTDIYGFIQNNHLSCTLITDLSKKYSVENYMCYMLHCTSLIFEANEFINSLISKLNCDDIDIINRYGLLNEEYQTWDIDLFDRIFNGNIDNYIMEHVNKDVQQKITYNYKFL